MKHGRTVFCLQACALASLLVATPAFAETTLILRFPDDKYEAASDRACEFFRKCPGDFEGNAQYLMNKLVSFISFETYKGMESLGMTLEVRRDE